jgi:hypothetical protein
MPAHASTTVREGRRPHRLWRTGAPVLGVVSLVVACGSDAPRAGTAAADTLATGEPVALRALADSLLPTLEQLSGLAASQDVRIQQRSVAQVRAYVQQQLADEMPPAELAGVQATYALLGLIPDTLDLGALLLDLYSEQIVGYYDPETKTLYAVEGVPAESLRPVVAHELVHALQDQHADLDSLISRERGNDRQLAAQAAIEGHAMLVMFALLAGEAAGQMVDPATLPNPAEQLRLALESPGADLPVFRRAPRALQEMLLFPYVAGASFVQTFWRTGLDDTRAPPLGEDLPQSTEQVLWPVAHFIDDRDSPTELRFADAGEWRVLYGNTLGAFETRLFLHHHLGADTMHARGWDGDRFVLLEAADSARALVWTSIWDDDASADAFVAQLRRISATPAVAAADIRRETLDGRPIVRVIIAPGDALASAVPTLRVSCVDSHGAAIACSTAENAEVR